MERSAAQASAATSRPLETTDFAGNAVIQTTPTGRFGVVYYSFNWKNFAKTGTDLSLGDRHLPGGCTWQKTILSLSGSLPDLWSVLLNLHQTRYGMVSYDGQRSFGAGEPRLVFERSGFTLQMLLLGAVIVVFLTGGLALVLRKSNRDNHDNPDENGIPLSVSELVSLEERIIQLLKTSGGEQYQSEIVKTWFDGVRTLPGDLLYDTGQDEDEWRAEAANERNRPAGAQELPRLRRRGGAR